jgi:virginiamycin B lyase
VIGPMTDEQLDERIRAYLSYRAEFVASHAASAEAASTAIAGRLRAGGGRAVAPFSVARVAFALLLLLLALVAAVYVGSLFRERYAPERPLVVVPLQGQPWAVTGAYGSIWVGSLGQASVYQLNPRDGTVTNEVALVEPVCGNIERGYGAIWAAGCGTHALTRIDPRSLDADRLVGYGSDGIGVGGDSVWASDGSNVVRLDPQTLETQAEIAVGGDSIVTFGEGSAWAMLSDRGSVARIDPATNHVVATIPLSSGPEAPAYPVHAVAAGGALWVVDEVGLRLYRVDAVTNTATSVPIPLTHEATDGMDFGDWYITSGRGLIWVRISDETVVGFDPTTSRVVQTQATTPGGGGAFFVADDSLWVGNNGDGTVSGMQLP